MKNNKIKKTVIAASLCLVASVTTLTNVEAQWSVIDVNSNSMKTTLEKMKDGIEGTINQLQGVRQGQEAQVKQSDQYQEDTDKRNRLSAGVAESLRRDLDAMPTIQQCAEMTARSGNSAAVSASLSGGGAGSRGTPGTKEHLQSKIVDNSTVQASVLENTRDSKTCAGGMDDAIDGCSGKGTYAGADVNSSSLKRNYASKDKLGIMDNSLNADGFKAAEANAKIATMYAAPPSFDADTQVNQIKKNPAYVAIYKPVIAKLNASYEALMEVASNRRAPAAVTTGVAGQIWEKTKGDYKQTFGVNAPAVPSFFELLNFAVMREFSGPPKEKEPENEKELLAEINKKMALQNVIAMQQYKATETSNILLAHLLTQAVTPVNVENVRAEAAKTKNIK